MKMNLKNALLTIQLAGLIATVFVILVYHLSFSGLVLSYSDYRINLIKQLSDVKEIKDTAALIDSRLKTAAESTNQIATLVFFYSLCMLIIFCANLLVIRKIRRQNKEKGTEAGDSKQA